MRRKDREITDYTQIAAIMNSCDTCRLGLVENQLPYIVPLSFGYKMDEKHHITLYFHSANECRKLDIIRQNNKVAFEMDTAHELFGHDTEACGYGMRYQCVMGTGTARLVEDEAEKLHAFDQIMAHYTDKKLPYKPQYLHTATIIATDVVSISCKVHK